MRSASPNDVKPPTASAGSRLCNIAELLEMILEHLSPLDLLLTQRVNRPFRRTIQQSTILKRQLFLLPALSGQQDARLNPLLTQPAVLAKLPLYLDIGSSQLRTSPGPQRERLRVQRLRIMMEFHKTERYISFRLEGIIRQSGRGDNDQPTADKVDLAAGSWRQMMLSHSGFDIRLFIAMTPEDLCSTSIWYTGRMIGFAGNMDNFLSLVVELPLRRRESTGRRLRQRLDTGEAGYDQSQG